MRISDWSSDVCSSDLGRRGDGFRFVAPIDQKACKIALKVNDCRTRWSRVLIPENGLLSGGIFGGTNGKVTLLRSTGIKRLPGLFASWWVRCRATRYLPHGTQAGQSGTKVPHSGKPPGDLARPRQPARQEQTR